MPTIVYDKPLIAAEIGTHVYRLIRCQDGWELQYRMIINERWLFIRHWNNKHRETNVCDYVRGYLDALAACQD